MSCCSFFVYAVVDEMMSSSYRLELKFLCKMYLVLEGVVAFCFVNNNEGAVPSSKGSFKGSSHPLTAKYCRGIHENQFQSTAGGR